MKGETLTTRGVRRFIGGVGVITAIDGGANNLEQGSKRNGADAVK